MEKGTQDGQYERHANASNASSSSIWPPSYGRSLLEILQLWPMKPADNPVKLDEYAVWPRRHGWWSPWCPWTWRWL